jgi:sulfate adenylyltransferase
MLRLSEPHAGVLVHRLAGRAQEAALRERARALPAVALSPAEALDLDLVATGAASPLEGFMGARDHRSVLDALRLADGTPWPVPFTLAVGVAELAPLRERGAAALYEGGRLRAVMEVTDAFVRDPREEAWALCGTDDPHVRGVAALLARPAGTIGGRVTALPRDAGALPPPGEVRAAARRQRWDGIRGVAALGGGGCLEPVGAARPTLLPIPRVAVTEARGRDAFLQAIVLKNFGAREVLFEYDRADWLAVSARVIPEDLGLVPVWTLPRAARTAHRPRGPVEPA